MLPRFSPLRAACPLAALALTAAASAQNVVINEYWSDDSAAFPVEYIELHSPTGADLTGLSLVAVDGNTGGSTTDSRYRRLRLRIDFAPGTSIEPNGYYLAGHSLPASYTVDQSFPAGSIPNATMTIALARTQDVAVCTTLQVCPQVDFNKLTADSIAAITANLVDAIAVTDADAADHIYFNAPALGPNPGGFAWDAGARVPNGVDTDSPADWATQDNFGFVLDSPQDLISTPGAPNDSATGACCLPNGECRLLTPAQCGSLGGVYAGNGSTCGQVVCQPPGSCLCEVDGQPGTTVFDLLEFLDCWFEGCP